jgi:signal transduction histidine kinase/DNA-binding response OmpR family regulator
MSMIRILHVEDNAADIDLLRMQLTRADSEFSLKGVTSVEKALEVMEKERFDCIICDMQLPRKNGLEMLQALRSAGVRVPFIFHTGQGTEELAAEALRMGASDYYTKEFDRFDVHQLVNSIRKHVEGYRLRLEHEEILKRSRQTELNYDRLIENLTLPICSIGNDRAVLRLNPAFKSLLGDIEEKSDQTTGVSFKAFSPQANKLFNSKLNLAFDSGQVLMHQFKDLELYGEVFSCDFTFIPVEFEKKIASVIVICERVRDVGDSSASNVSLREELQRERSALKQVSERFRGQLTDRIKFEKIFTVMHELARSLTTAKDSNLFYRQICESLGNLVNTDNVFIAIHEYDSVFAFPYVRDSFDNDHLSHLDLAGCLTDFTFRSGKSQLIDKKRRQELREKGEISSSFGTESEIWMGIPLQAEDHPFGVLVVQSYDDPNAYTLEDLEILTILSNHFALAIRKKMAEDQLMKYQLKLEERVRERTHDLQAVNIQMQREIELRRKSELLLSSLYKLSRGALTASSLSHLIEIIQGEIEILFPGTDIFITRNNHQTGELEYICKPKVDEVSANNVEKLMDRVLTHGQSIYYTSNKGPFVDNSLREDLKDSENSWMAAPLITHEGVQGGIVLRSSNLEKSFSQSDYSIFTSISLNLSQSIEKKISDEERIILLEHQQEKNQQLQNVNQELEAFVYSVSHDLRKPIRHIHGFSYLLSDYAEEKSDKEVVKLTGKIRAACDNMNSLVDDLLQLSRLNNVEINRENVNISGLAKSLIHEMRDNEPDREIEVQIEEDLKTSAEPALARVLLQNLLENAWKFTRNTEKPSINVFSAETDGKKYFAVSDNGAGFDNGKNKDIFAPFVRLHKDSEYEGTGIGLATVARIIHRHGGSIKADSEAGKGATFYFRF